MITFLDTFTGPDGTMVGHIPEVGAAWGVIGDWQILGNRLICDETSGTHFIQNQAPEFNFINSFKLIMPVTGNAHFEYDFRVISGSNLNFLDFDYNGTTDILVVKLAEVVGGSGTEIHRTSLVAAAGAELKVQMLVIGKHVTVKIGDSAFNAEFSVVHNGDFFQFDAYMDGGNESFLVDDMLFAASPITEDAMINLRTGQWNMHREGVAKLLAIAGQALCDGTALAVTAEVRLYTNAVAPGCDDEAADYTEATFSGYAPVLIDSGDDGCTDILEIGVDGDGIGQIIFDQQAWTEGSPATITETVTGAYFVLIIGGDDFLLASFPFDIPVPMAVAGDILKVSGFSLLDCQMVPVA
jgi:hypothetical protein